MGHALRDGVPEDSPLTGILEVQRQNIRFQAVGNELHIAIEVENTSRRISPWSVAIIEYAPFGAFLPWQMLSLLPVPRFRPGQSRTLALRAPRPAAGGSGLPPLRPGDPVHRKRSAVPGVPSPGCLAWLVRVTPELVGNLNVHIGGRAIERHLSGPLRAFPGKTNFAAFFVGDGDDEYRFDLEGSAPEWRATLVDMQAWERDEIEPPEILQGTWIESTETLTLGLRMEPPPDAQQGQLEVRVTQRSSGNVAIVEFDLDANAEGAACYTA